MNLIHVAPQPSDNFSIALNKAEMQYDKGFGRRYTYSAGISLMESVGTSASVLYDLLKDFDHHAVRALIFNDKDAAKICRKDFEMISKGFKIMAGGLAIGTAKLFASIAMDPFKLACEAFEKRQCPQGRTALLVIDAQKDFTQPGKQVIDGVEHTYEAGGLGVNEGYAVVPVINTLMERLAPGNFAAASLDWHPEGHKSFASSTPGTNPFETIRLGDTDQTLWPNHCIQGTEGATFLPGLLVSKMQYVVRKGLDLFVDSYSAFFDNGKKNQTALHEYLQGRNVKNVVVTGIATDYCVKFTALDAKALGYDVTVVIDACRGVDLGGSVAAAVDEMKSKGIKVLSSAEALKTEAFI